MNLNHISRLAKALCLMMLLALPLHAQPPCRQVQFNARPAWTISGAWTKDGSSLLVVDALNSKVLRYSVEGKLLEALTEKTPGFPKDFRPSSIQATDTGFLLLSETARILTLSNDLTYKGEVNLLDTAKGRQGQLSSVFDWAAVSANEIVAFSDIKLANDEWITAFVRVSLKYPAGFKVLGSFGVDEPGRNFYLFGHPYIAALGGKIYVVTMPGTPSLVEISGGEKAAKPLHNAMPKQARPILPPKKGLETVRSLFQVIESSNLPVGLVSWHEHLYLLARRPSLLDKSTTWSLSKIEPASGEVIYSAEIPTSANHLTVVPGPNYWAFIEKGEVKGLGQQEIASMRLISSRIIENPPSSGVKAGSLKLCE